MKKKPEITNKTRQIFVDVFCEIYAEKPVEKITIQEITKKSGFSRSTFYQYFCDIYELLDYVENDVLEYIRGALDKNKNDELSEIEHIIKVFEAKGKYLNALMGNCGNIRFIEKLKKELRFERSNLDIRKDDMYAPYLMEFYVSTTLSMFRLWNERNRDLKPEELFELIYRLRLGAMKNNL